MLLDADDEPAEGPNRRLLSRKTWAILIAVVVSMAVVVTTVSYLVFILESEDSPMILTQLVDKMRDTDGDGFPG